MTKKKTIKEKLNMAKTFAEAIVSRGLSNKKTDTLTKQLRVISCFGDGVELPPCEYLRESKTNGKHFCGGCGCGDRKSTWLDAEGEDYSKLDYPKLGCPLNMPGFTNYEKSEPDEAEEPVTRRYYIEEMSEDRIKNMAVNVYDVPEPKLKDKE